MFAHIEALNDVLPHITFENGIRLKQRDGYQVLDYAFVDKHTFAGAMALECRGLKLDPDSALIARPFHKFFNLGEKELPEAVDFSAPHIVQEKRDGSMIHPCLLNGSLVFMTRGGLSTQAAMAFEHADQGVLDLCNALLAQGITAMFEFTSPQNRVVIAYDTPALTLLAARHMHSGTYLSFEALAELAATYGVPLVRSFDPVRDITGFVAQARALEDNEGYVIAFETGHRIKLKADAYALRHKALDGLRFEKNVLAWIAGGAVDDVLPLLHGEARDQLRAYAEAVEASVTKHVVALEAFHAENAHLERGDYARLAQATLDKRLTRVAFALRDGRDAREDLMKIIAWASGSENRPAQVRDLLGATWEALEADDLDA